ncbi:MAG: cupredoxin domain-containing protein [Dehalococcoidia bacterium]
MYRTLPLFGAVAGAFILLAACGGDDADRRVIQITQTDDLCTPESIDLAAGEKVKFEVKNEGSKDKELEGIEGTKLEEILVPSGKTRSINYNAPDEAGAAKVKCYVPGGSNNIITLNIQ